MPSELGTLKPQFHSGYTHCTNEVLFARQANLFTKESLHYLEEILDTFHYFGKYAVLR